MHSRKQVWIIPIRKTKTVALGAGTELTSNYKNIKLSYLGIENIHAIRDSLVKLHTLSLESQLIESKITLGMVEKTGWMKHLKTIMNGASLIVQAMEKENKHVIIHCS